MKGIAFLVDDVEKAFDQVVANGAKPVAEPTSLADDHGHVLKATIAVYGDIVHSFVQRNAYRGPFLQGYQALTNREGKSKIGWREIDHLAISAEAGMLDELVEFYCHVFGFHESHHEEIASEYSAMNSKVVQDSTGGLNSRSSSPRQEKGDHKSASIFLTIMVRASNISPCSPTIS